MTIKSTFLFPLYTVSSECNTIEVDRTQNHHNSWMFQEDDLEVDFAAQRSTLSYYKGGALLYKA